MSLWADYVTELRGPEYRQWLEYPDCFAAYSLPKASECIIIHDMYVKPELRQDGRGKTLLEDLCEIGRKAGRRWVISEVEIATLTAATAMKAQLAAGFAPVSTSLETVIMRKELSHGHD